MLAIQDHSNTGLMTCDRSALPSTAAMWGRPSHLARMHIRQRVGHILVWVGPDQLFKWELATSLHFDRLGNELRCVVSPQKARLAMTSVPLTAPSRLVNSRCIVCSP